MQAQRRVCRAMQASEPDSAFLSFAGMCLCLHRDTSYKEIGKFLISFASLTKQDATVRRDHVVKLQGENHEYDSTARGN